MALGLIVLGLCRYGDLGFDLFMMESSLGDGKNENLRRDARVGAQAMLYHTCRQAPMQTSQKNSLLKKSKLCPPIAQRTEEEH